MAILNNDYVVKRPSDYVSKLGISYQGMEDFYSPDKYNDGLYLLEKELENIELTDEKLHVVAEDKKLSEVLPTVARKGEILPKDIKGNTDYITSFLLPNLTLTGELEYRFVNGDGVYKSGFTNLSNTYAKRTDLESLQTTVSDVKQDISNLKNELNGYVARHVLANDGIQKSIND